MYSTVIFFYKILPIQKSLLTLTKIILSDFKLMVFPKWLQYLHTGLFYKYS